MKKIYSIIAAIAVILTTTYHCAEASNTGNPPPFAFQTLDLNDLHIEYDATIEVSNPYRVDYNQLLIPDDLKKTCVPGRINTFAFVATISAVGTYTLYGAGAGPVTAAIIYIATDGDKKHKRQAIWGCITGMVVGGVVKWLSVR
ncbi:MAG: hypothetical protein K6F33_11610 [Bacteroidales bacterium]|nr:hypothetical protein [Bacteroidales bacterium]